MNRSEAFAHIYKTGLWNDNLSNIPLSGPGSSLENTNEYRKMLDSLCSEHKIESIVDLGCGDLTWMPTTNAFQTCKYTGVDIVQSLITTHAAKYTDKTFLCLDIVKDYIPSGDLVIIRDVLFHLSFDDIAKVLENIKGKFKYYLITSCKNVINNNSFDRYLYHPINLTMAPFEMKGYKIVLEEPVFNRNVLLFEGI